MGLFALLRPAVLVGMAQVALAQAAPAPAPSPGDAPPPDTVVLDADKPVEVRINGQPVQLMPTTGDVDHIMLNQPTVTRLGLAAQPLDQLGDLRIGGKTVLRGRHGSGRVQVAGRRQLQQIYWFPGLSPFVHDGSIGPFALPHRTVQVAWADGDPRQYAWRLVGGINTLADGVAAVGGRAFYLGVDVRRRRALPLATASTAADLAAVLGGRLEGPVWQEEIAMGIKRPVRRMRFDRPVEVGPFRFSDVAVRVRDSDVADGLSRLGRGQQPLRAGDEDPSEIVVRGRNAGRRSVVRALVLSRTQLDAFGCTRLIIDKRQRLFILACGAAG
jgi:hypothetical protein